MNWERIDESAGGTIETFRAEVPGGWIYRVDSYTHDDDGHGLVFAGSSITFVPKGG